LHEKITDVFGNTVEMKIWNVPKSKHMPHGYKYSLVYIVDGERVIGYDNAEGKGDHRHMGEREYKDKLKSLRRLVRDFQSEIFRKMSRVTGRGTMRVKRVRIGIKDMNSFMDDFVRTAQAIKRGEKVKKSRGIYFTSLEAFRKVLTVQRMSLLRLIREEKPASLHQLARLSRRNIKNVSDDVKYLSQVGLIELNESGKKISALVNYDKILLEIAV